LKGDDGGGDDDDDYGEFLNYVGLLNTFVALGVIISTLARPC